MDLRKLAALGTVPFLLGLTFALGWRYGGHQRPASPPGEKAVTTYYLLDFEHSPATHGQEGSTGHLVVFNPGDIPARLQVKLFFEDAEPESMTLEAPARTTIETNTAIWPMGSHRRGALQVDSSAPVVCQATVGWYILANSTAPPATQTSPSAPRECAKSYLAHSQLAADWLHADGIVLQGAGLWARESEYALVLNPGPEPAQVMLQLHLSGTTIEHPIRVLPRRLHRLRLDDLVQANVHYGARFHSDQPIAVQWQREVRWPHSEELMSYWSVPCLAGPGR